MKSVAKVALFFSTVSSYSDDTELEEKHFNMFEFQNSM